MKILCYHRGHVLTRIFDFVIYDDYSDLFCPYLREILVPLLQQSKIIGGKFAVYKNMVICR